MGGILGSGSSAKQPTAAGSLHFSSAQRAAVAYRSSMARCASPGYNRVAGTNAIGGDTQEDGVTLLARAITFSAGAGSTGLVIQGAPTSTWPFRFGNIAGLTGGNAGASRTIDGFTGGQTVSVELAFLSFIQPGDQFQILPGCDRTMTTCINVFNNQQLGQSTRRFGGFPLFHFRRQQFDGRRLRIPV